MDDEFAELAREYGIDTDEDWYGTDDSGVAFLPPDQGNHQLVPYGELDEWVNEYGDHMRFICIVRLTIMNFESFIVSVSSEPPERTHAAR